MSLFHTEKGPLEDKIKRVEAIIDKGLIINWRVNVYRCMYYIVGLFLEVQIF